MLGYGIFAQNFIIAFVNTEKTENVPVFDS